MMRAFAARRDGVRLETGRTKRAWDNPMPSQKKKFTVIDGGGKPRTDHPHPDLQAVPGRRKKRRGDALPATMQPIGLRREEAAAYIGVSATIFDRMVADGLMPKGMLVYCCRIWKRRKLELAFDALDSGASPEDDWGMSP